MDSTAISTSVLDQLPADCQKKLEGYAKAIDRAQFKANGLALEIGQHLALAHAALSHHGNGIFGKWVESRCGISRMTAHKWMRVHEVFGGMDCKVALQTSSTEALYLLSKDTTPEEAIEAAVEQAEAGERITLKRAKEIVASAANVVAEESSVLDDIDEPAELPDYVKRLQPYESLSDGIEALDAAVAAIYLRWPPEYMAVLADKLISLGEELNEKGKLIC